MQYASASRDHVLIGLLAVSYACVAFVVVFTPPAQTLHAESSAICAAAGFLFVGLCVLYTGRGQSAKRAVSTALVWPLLPLAGLTAATAARPSCLTVDGLMLYAAFVPPSALFGAALAYFVRLRVKRLQSLVFVVAGFLIATASVAFDLLGHPQFYTYSHVFGGVLGPIYDRMLAVRPGVFTFRLLTLLWAGLLFLLAQPSKAGYGVPSGVLRRHVVVGILLAALCTCYILRGQLGINTTSAKLRAALSGHVATEHFDFYFDPATPDAFSPQHVAATAEYEYERLKVTLGVAPSKRVTVYLYPDADRRAWLTGARTTSVAPVWLPSPQIHLLASRAEDSFSHELVHVFTREIGAPVIRASPLIGLVEGLAGALESPSTGLDADAVVRVAANEFGWTASDVAGRLQRAMTPGGFWRGRGAVNYSLSASFGRYLLDNYPADTIAALYASGRFGATMSRSLDFLAADWAVRLLADTSSVAPMAGRGVRSAFSTASLFELSCPHAIPRSFKALVAGDGAWRRGDTLVAKARWHEASTDARLDGPISERVALAALFDGDTQPALALAGRDDSTLTVSGLIVLADAHAIGGNAPAALVEYAGLMGRIRGAAIDDEAAVAIRMMLANVPDAIAAFYDDRDYRGRAGYDSNMTRTSVGTPQAWGQSRRAAQQGRFTLADSLLRSVSVPASDSLESLLSWYRAAQLARYSERAGSWEMAAQDWRSASNVVGINRFAVHYAQYRERAAAWIHQNPHLLDEPHIQ